jgi:hypothetical protein
VDWKGSSNKKLVSTLKVGYERRELTYGGLSNSEGGEKRKDRDGLHDERKERGSGGETTSPAAPDVQYVRALVRRVEGWRGGARKVRNLSIVDGRSRRGWWCSAAVAAAG